MDYLTPLHMTLLRFFQDPPAFGERRWQSTGSSTHDIVMAALRRSLRAPTACSFGELFAGGVPATTPLIIKSEGPPSPAPASDAVPEFGADCLRGEIASGFSLLLYEGGSVEDLDSCAEGRDVSAVCALVDGEYVPYILGAPEFVNDDFVGLFPEGLAAVTPLVAKSD